MAGISLPELPRGREFEEYVAAVFQSSGFYLERDITEREGIEILQLDSISTDYDHKPPQIQIIEAKSGDWGFKDIFKIKGWMSYLGIDNSTLIAGEYRDRFDSYKAKCKALGVKLIYVDDPANYNEWFKEIRENIYIDQRDVWSWRYYYWLERLILERTRAQKNCQPKAKRFKAILDYAFDINSGVFFSETVAERVEALYDSYGRNRTLAACCGYEMEGKDFGSEDGQIPSSLFNETFYDCKYNEIQAACMVEQYARLTLLKAAVDYISYKSAGHISKAEKLFRLKIKDRVHEISILSFPGTFDRALEEIKMEPYFHRYPIFWQWFIGIFGGFIMNDYKEDEYKMLSSKSGIPIEQIDFAFDSWNKLFPLKGGWFREDTNSNIRLLMLYPAPMRGVGANYRRVMHKCEDKYERLKVTGRYTISDLAKWNNASVEILKCSVSAVRKA